MGAGCATAPAPASDRDLTVSEGTTFTVALDRRAGTGYGWMVDGADAQTVTLVARSIERDVAAPGAPEREVFVFLAKRLRHDHAALLLWPAVGGGDADARRARLPRPGHPLLIRPLPTPTQEEPCSISC
jgi:hypothetical protein